MIDGPKLRQLGELSLPFQKALKYLHAVGREIRDLQSQAYGKPKSSAER